MTKPTRADDNRVGERNLSAKITAQTVRDIREMFVHEHTIAEIIILLNLPLTWGSVQAIVQRRTWKHVK